jgi:hypothetical protein
VKAAMLAVAGGQGDLLVSRDAHKAVVAGLGLPQLVTSRPSTTSAMSSL